MSNKRTCFAKYPVSRVTMSHRMKLISRYAKFAFSISSRVNASKTAELLPIPPRITTVNPPCFCALGRSSATWYFSIVFTSGSSTHPPTPFDSTVVFT